MGKRGIRVVLILVVALTVCVVSLWRVARGMPVDTPPIQHPILIDPGHGGVDGGTIAANGTLEKDINLAIGKSLADFLRLCGCPVSMTRDTDISIHDAEASTIREKKVSDLKNRLALCEQASLVISIHQNHFSGTQYFGTQVFYSPNAPASQPLAASIRESVRTLLQPDNRRALKQGSSSVYLLHHATVPAVLVECGFLSNATERQKLETPAYQQELALAIGLGVLHLGT